MKEFSAAVYCDYLSLSHTLDVLDSIILCYKK